MDLTLSPDGRERFTTALDALLSAAAHDDDERWGRAATAALTRLADAANAVLVLQCGRAVRAFGDGISHELLHRIVQSPKASPTSGADDLPPPRTRVWCRRAGHGEISEVAVDGARYEAVGMTAALDLPGVNASLACHYHGPRSAAETRGHLETLRLVMPAFVAGARERMFAAPSHRALTRLLDALSAGTLLFARDGSVLYENAALARLLAAEPQRTRIRNELWRAAMGFRMREAAALSGGGDCPAALRDFVAQPIELRSDTGRYRVRCCEIAPDGPGGAAAIAVSLERLMRVDSPADASTAVTALPVEALRRTYGLTDREVDVTHLLLHGKSNADIAHTLGVSPHTARHHTQKVLDKLGATSRAQVPSLLRSVEQWADASAAP
ncbi:MAG TPA: helix-turn-helix transcriptional regulator [Gemmatimonadaceae bacterium]|nr:helix-turn-helix transcriptional regulator [Gemmatimonadaceae bacterium]